jgi:hypothetical protein
VFQVIAVLQVSLATAVYQVIAVALATLVFQAIAELELQDLAVIVEQEPQALVVILASQVTAVFQVSLAILAFQVIAVFQVSLAILAFQVIAVLGYLASLAIVELALLVSLATVGSSPNKKSQEDRKGARKTEKEPGRGRTQKGRNETAPLNKVPLALPLLLPLSPSL